MRTLLLFVWIGFVLGNLVLLAVNAQSGQWGWATVSVIGTIASLWMVYATAAEGG